MAGGVMAGGNTHADALARAEQLVREAEGSAERPDGPAAARNAWEAVQVLKEARARSSRGEAERGKRSPLYVRAVEAVKKSGNWAEARKLAAHLRFDRDARPQDREALAGVVRQANEALKLAGPPEECNLVMKGGITSGVLYPRALGTLSD